LATIEAALVCRKRVSGSSIVVFTTPIFPYSWVFAQVHGAGKRRSEAVKILIIEYGCIIVAMRTTLTLDDDVYGAAQAHAQATGKRLGRVLSEMARQALHPTVQLPGKGSSRFPAFEVPAGARLIPASRVQEALDEDGIA
jgi:hypothetical protein